MNIELDYTIDKQEDAILDVLTAKEVEPPKEGPVEKLTSITIEKLDDEIGINSG